jgi:hypothetical protein
MTIDNQQRSAALAEALAEAFVESVRERDELAADVGDLLDVARQVRTAATRSIDIPTDLVLAIDALEHAVERSTACCGRRHRAPWSMAEPVLNDRRRAARLASCAGDQPRRRGREGGPAPTLRAAAPRAYDSLRGSVALC